jgi:hypothetical protein
LLFAIRRFPVLPFLASNVNLFPFGEFQKALIFLNVFPFFFVRFCADMGKGQKSPSSSDEDEEKLVSDGNEEESNGGYDEQAELDPEELEAVEGAGMDIDEEEENGNNGSDSPHSDDNMDDDGDDEDDIKADEEVT